MTDLVAAVEVTDPDAAGGVTDPDAADGVTDNEGQGDVPVTDKNKSTVCDSLGGTHPDAQGLHDESGEHVGHILSYALWVETSYIPGADWRACQGELTLGDSSHTIGDVHILECY